MPQSSPASETRVCDASQDGSSFQKCIFFFEHQAITALHLKFYIFSLVKQSGKLPSPSH